MSNMDPVGNGPVSVDFDDWDVGFSPSGEAEFLPEPPRQLRRYTVISVDDHLVEPPTTFAGRFPKRFQDRGPRIVEREDGAEVWVFDDQVLANIGLNATAGRPQSQWSADPSRFDHMRRGAWDVQARLADMDLDGTYASLNFGSFLPGFAGTRLQTVTNDRDLALAAIQAWNSWHIEDWVGASPERFIACQLPWLHDPAVGAAEVRKNAARGFKAVSFPDDPNRLGWPSIHTDHWDPIFQACAETGTVVCIHVGSGGGMPPMSPGAPKDVGGVMFGTYAMMYTIEWLFSRVAHRFPDIKICISEGGIGWVAALLDRLEHVFKYQGVFHTWDGIDITPADMLRRNFWFCALQDRSAWIQIDRIGVDRVTVEVDYPHGDTTWPTTQDQLAAQLEGLDSPTIEKVTWRNASELFRHPVPKEIQKNPEAF